MLHTKILLFLKRIEVLAMFLNFFCRFLQKYPENPQSEESLEISLDEVAKELGRNKHIYNCSNYKFTVFDKLQLKTNCNVIMKL